MVKVGNVEIEWVSDPGGKVEGQWRVKTPFWECYPTEQELEDVIKAATQAIQRRKALKQN